MTFLPEIQTTAARVLSACCVRPDERVVIYADSGTPSALPGAFLAAATTLGCDPVLVEAKSRLPMVEPPREAIAAMKHSDFILDMATQSWLYTMASREVMVGHGRMLQVRGTVGRLISRPPSAEITARARAADPLFNQAPVKRVRVTSSLGTDLTASYEGRLVCPQDGVADRPGDWDSVGTAWANAFPLESTSQGTVVINGPCYLAGASSYIPSRPFTVRVVDGRVVAVEGGAEADPFRHWLTVWNDPNVAVVAHIGFGWDRRCGPPPKPVEERDFGSWEGMYGAVIIAFGANRGRPIGGGENVARSHSDCVLLGADYYIGERQVLEEGRFLVPEFQEDGPA